MTETLYGGRIVNHGSAIPVVVFGNLGDSFTPVATHGQLTDLSSVQNLTPPEGAVNVLLSVTGQNVRFTMDGTTAPTSTLGLLLYTGMNPVRLDVPNNVTLKLIEVASGAKVDYQWGN